MCVDGFAVERDGDASEAFYPPGGEEGVPGHVSMQRVVGGDHGIGRHLLMYFISI